MPTVKDKKIIVDNCLYTYDGVTNDSNIEVTNIKCLGDDPKQNIYNNKDVVKTKLNTIEVEKQNWCFRSPLFFKVELACYEDFINVLRDFRKVDGRQDHGKWI